MEWMVIAVVAAVIVAVAAAVSRQHRRDQRRQRSEEDDPHAAWVQHLKEQVSRRRPGDDTQPWSRDE
jgi:type II secretory pathway component PulK